MTTAAKPKAGLEDTVATSSAICYLDGDRGVLAYCGYDIHDLARHATFEEVCYLLWHRRLPTRAELGDLQSQLVAARPLPEPVLRLMRTLPPGNGMDALRTLTSALGHYDRRRRRQFAAGELPQGRAPDRADQLDRGDDGPDGHGRRPDPARSGARPRRELSSTCSPASGRAGSRRAPSTSR